MLIISDQDFIKSLNIDIFTCVQFRSHLNQPPSNFPSVHNAKFVFDMSKI